MPHELTQIKKKKKIILKWLKWSESLFYATKNHFSTRLWHVTKNGQLARTEKKLQSTSQSPTCTKEKSWSLFGGLLPVWSTTALWILVKPLHLRSILSKSMRCTKNACSWHWSTEWAQSFSNFAQPLIAQPMLQKLNGLGYEVLPHPPYSPDLSPTDYHFMHLDDFFQGKCFYKEEAENAHFEFTESQAWIFMLQE